MEDKNKTSKDSDYGKSERKEILEYLKKKQQENKEK